jgi:hypothetical protein
MHTVKNGGLLGCRHTLNFEGSVMSIFEGAVTSFTIHKKKLRTTRASLTRSLPLFPFLFKDPYALRAGYTFLTISS